jgi:hypothetical protein
MSVNLTDDITVLSVFSEILINKFAADAKPGWHQPGHRYSVIFYDN